MSTAIEQDDAIPAIPLTEPSRIAMKEIDAYFRRPKGRERQETILSTENIVEIAYRGGDPAFDGCALDAANALSTVRPPDLAEKLRAARRRVEGDGNDG